MDDVDESISKELQDESKGIHAIFYKNKDGEIFGFIIHGHSGYAEAGSDIVCSAISALTFNTVNSIERFTNDKVSFEQKEGYLKCILLNEMSKESSLLMKSTSASMEDVQYHKDGDVIVAAGNAQRKEVVSWIRTFTQI